MSNTGKYKILRDPIHVINSYVDTMNKHEKLAKQSIINRQNTINSRSEETKARISAYETQKQEDLKKKKGLEELINPIYIKLLEQANLEPDDFFKNYETEFIKLQTLSNELKMYFDKPLNTPFDKLCIELLRTNQNFVLSELFPVNYALKYNNFINFSKFSDEEIKLFSNRLRNSGLLTETTIMRTSFQQTYIQFFPEYLDKVQNPKSAFYMLKSNPELFKKIKHKFKSAYDNNAKGFLKCALTSNRNVIKEFDAEDFEVLKTSNQLALLVTTHTELIKYLPNNFFNFKTIKYIKFFRPKEELLEIYKPYFDKFPELKIYLETKYYMSEYYLKEDAYSLDSKNNITDCD